jgi:hypothetical protein
VTLGGEVQYQVRVERHFGAEIKIAKIADEQPALSTAQQMSDILNVGRVCHLVEDRKFGVWIFRHDSLRNM